MKNGKKVKGVLLKKRILTVILGVIVLTLLYNMTDISSIKRTINILKSFNEGTIIEESTPINSDNDLEIKKTINGCTTTTIKASLLGNSGINTLSVGIDSANLFVKGLVSPKEKLSNPNCAPCSAGGTNPGQPDPVGPENPGKDDLDPNLPDEDDSDPTLPPDETEDKNFPCEAWLESFTVNAAGNKVKPGQTYVATMKYVVNGPKSGESQVNFPGYCVLGKTGITIDKPIGLNETTGVYNSSFEGDDNLEVPFSKYNQGATVETKMTIKIPDSYTSGQQISLVAIIKGNNESSVVLTVEGGSDVACESGITDKSLAGKHGVAMNAKAIYDTSELKNVTGNANPGTKFEILGENGKLWAINYEGKCGWVDSTYMAINGVEYLPDIRFNITNASASIYRSSGKDIAGLTGLRLYNSSEYNNSFVPITYSFAKKLKIASANARAGGDTLVVYDAYRPSSVSALAKARLDVAMSDSEIKEGIMYSYGASGTKYSWGKIWFLAQGKSAHNNACAVDITLSGQEGAMPSAMHELSTRAIKYYSPQAPRTSKGFSTGMLNSVAAQKLHNYMMSGTGLTDLASEWWHYQLKTGCNDTVAAADFWS